MSIANKLTGKRVMLIAVVAVVSGLALIGTLFTRSTPSLASSSRPSPVEPNLAASSGPQSGPQPSNASLPASAANFTCNAGTYGYGVDSAWTAVICDNGPITNPTWFAISSSDPRAALYLSTFTTGFVMGKGLIVYYDTDATLVNGLCLAANCRKIYTVYVLR